MLSPRKVTAILFIFALLVVYASPTYAKTVPVEAKDPCRLEVDYAHISKGKLRLEGVKYVKVKARSICIFPQRNVTIELKIMKLGAFYDQEVRTFRNNPLLTSSSGIRVEMNNALVRCKNSRLTYYFGIATSRTFVMGQWLYAKETYSIKPVPLRCGT